MRGEMMIIIISLSIGDNNNQRSSGWDERNSNVSNVEALVQTTRDFAGPATRSSPLLILGRVPTTGYTQRPMAPSPPGYVNSVVIAALQRTPSARSSPHPWETERNLRGKRWLQADQSTTLTPGRGRHDEPDSRRCPLHHICCAGGSRQPSQPVRQ